MTTFPPAPDPAIDPAGDPAAHGADTTTTTDPAGAAQTSGLADQGTTTTTTTTAADTPAPKRHQVGDTIEVRGFDPYLGAGGEEVSRYGIVVALDTLEGDNGTSRDAVRVAWLDAVSDPIATDDLDLG